MIHGEEVGGTTARTVRLEVATGRFLVSGPGTDSHEMPANGAKGRPA